MRNAGRPRAVRVASPLARAAWAAWALALVIGSLYPIGSWTPRGLDPWAFLTEPWPRWWTVRDVLLNVAAYVPLGLLGAIALWPRVRGRAAVLVALAAGTALSLGLEALQNWLPTRIPSRLDVLCNAAGTLVGAVAGAMLAPRAVGHARLLHWHRRWFEPHSRVALLLLAAWVTAQSAPQPLLFGAADASLPWREIAGAIAELFGLVPGEAGEANDAAAPAAGVAASLPLSLPDWLPGATTGILVEALTVIAAMVAVMLVVTACTREGAPRAALAGLVIAAALLARSLVAPLAVTGTEPGHWVTPGALGGLLCGALLALGAATLGARGRRRALLAALSTVLLAAQFAPDTGYRDPVASAWAAGPWRNVAGLLAGLATAWPLFALGWALRRR